MKIPKKIEKLLEQRARYGELVAKADTYFWAWLKTKGITENDENFDALYKVGSILLITEPDILTMRQKEILRKIR